MKRDHIMKYISIIMRKSQVHLNAAMKEFDLNSAEVRYLIHLDEEVRNLKEISRLVHLDDAQTTRVIRSLEQKDLIRKEPSSEDGRAFAVSLSEQGIALKPEILHRLDQWHDCLLQDLSEEEEDQLMDWLKLIARRAIQEIQGDAHD